jgi:hypothetical protein
MRMWLAVPFAIVRIGRGGRLAGAIAIRSPEGRCQSFCGIPATAEISSPEDNAATGGLDGTGPRRYALNLRTQDMAHGTKVDDNPYDGKVWQV